MGQHIAVFTGDLVNSTKAAADAVDTTMARIATTLGSLAILGDTPAMKFTRFRGDGWQAYSTAPALSLRIALCLAATLRTHGAGITTRIAIGIGTATSLGTGTLADASGPAFTASGHALDGMRKGQLFAIAGPATRGEDAAITALLDERIARWSPEQAIAADITLRGRNDTLQSMASRLHISPQAVSDRLRAAGLPAIKTALTLWETAKMAQGWTGHAT
jgi:hypothetical protein